METLHLDSDAYQIFITYFSVYNNIVCKYETITIYDDDLYYIKVIIPLGVPHSCFYVHNIERKQISLIFTVY